MKGRLVRFGAPILLLSAGAALPAAGADRDTPSVVIAIENHRFVPAEVTVPARQRVELIIQNRDATPEEFESTDQRREKIVIGRSKVSVWVGPLPPGTYMFFGEFHPDTARGRLIAK